MDLREQEYVTTLAKYKNITKASEILYISQPTLSIFIKRLEERMGVKLFQYVDKKMILTQIGELYVKKAKEMLLIQNQFLNEMSDLVSGYTGKIKLGIHFRRTMHFLPKLLREFEEKYPKIEISLTETRSKIMEEKLIDGELDLVFTNSITHTDKLNIVPLYKDKLLLAVSPNNPVCKYAKKIKSHKYEYLDLEYVKNERFILQAPNQATRIFTDKALEYSNVQPKKTFIIQNMETASQLAAEEYGIAFTMESYAKFFNYMKPVNFYETGSPDVSVNLYIIYRKDFYLTSYMQDFISLVKKYFL